MARSRRHQSDLDDDDLVDLDDGDDDDWRVRQVRSNPQSRFYDPRHAEPIRSGGPMGGWGEFDAAFLDETRPSVPAFPLGVLPSFWWDWVRDTARAAAAPADYVALSLLAAVGGLCGAGVAVRVAPGWSEPLVLWQLVVGASSSGKSPAIAPLRTLLGTVESEAAVRAKDDSDDASRSQAAIVTDSLAAALGEARDAGATGGMWWSDEAADWLPALAKASGGTRALLLRAWSAPRACSLLLSLPPERLPELAAIGAEPLARLLFTWPQAPPYLPLAKRKAAPDREALAALRRLAAVAGTADAPLGLPLDEQAVAPLDAFLARLHGELPGAEGLEQAWLGKGGGTVARLAGCLALLDWSAGVSPGPPNGIARGPVEGAIALWSDYLRPHARAVLHRTVPDDVERRARRVARWLRDRGQPTVSREEVRCEALGRSVNAAGADQVLYHLQAVGIVNQVHFSMPSHGGRPPNRWEVNPRLTAKSSAGNAANSGNLP
jgi:Protein of unknown function (DUF3987)